MLAQTHKDIQSAWCYIFAYSTYSECNGLMEDRVNVFGDEMTLHMDALTVYNSVTLI